MECKVCIAKCIFQPDFHVSLELCKFIYWPCLLNTQNKTSVFAEPVKSCTSVMGAIGGPCSGHLSLSQVAFVEGSAVGQMNSLLSISQTLVENQFQLQRKIRAEL